MKKKKEARSADSVKFEQQIKRIHDLLEQPGSKVTWDDSLPDPDNPSRERQIDVTIRREGTLTLVECRTHKGKQDVKWIEELIGRRISLRADAVIAVSASGFTRGAIKKAEKFGVILRDLRTLTEEEISSWGHHTQVFLTFYEFTQVRAIFRFKLEDIKNISLDQVEQYLHTSDVLHKILSYLANKIDGENRSDSHDHVKEMLTIQGLKINGLNVLAIDVETSFVLRREEMRIPSVVAYDAPKVEPVKREAFIEKAEPGEFEITQSSNDVFVTIDLTPVPIPPNCIFHAVNFDFQRNVNVRAWKVIGLPRQELLLDKLSIQLGTLVKIGTSPH